MTSLPTRRRLLHRRLRASGCGNSMNGCKLALSANGMGTWEMNLVTGRRTWSDQTCALHGINPADVKDGRSRSPMT